MRSSRAKTIPYEECVVGHLYKINSRNLFYGVFTGGNEGGFIGIREKFSDHFLFREYHHETGGSFGTVYPELDLGAPSIPVALTEYFGPYCEGCGKPTKTIYPSEKSMPWRVHYNDDQELPFKAYGRGESRGIDFFLCPPHRSTGLFHNTPLFNYLKPFNDRAVEASLKEWEMEEFEWAHRQSAQEDGRLKKDY